MDSCYHTGILIWERGLTYPHMEMVNHHFHIMGIEKFMIPVSIWDPRIETGIDASPFPYGDCPVSNPFP